MLGVTMTKDDRCAQMCMVMLSMREAWGQFDGVVLVSEEMDPRGDEMSSEKNHFCPNVTTVRYVRVFAIANPSVVCLSVCNIGAPYSGG